MSVRIKEQLTALARRAGVGDVSPLAVTAAGIVFASIVVIGAWMWLPRGTQTATFAARGAAPGTAAGATSAGSGASGGSRGAASLTAASAPSEAASTCVVHVVGAVRHPGVYELTPGRRVTDAVAAAGGFGSDAAQDAVNLAQLLQDGEQVAIPTREEAKAGGGTRAAGAAAASGAGGSAGGVVDVNTADAAALDALPGIGPSTAAKIVADRAANGRFATPDDLGRIPGIGPKKLEQLKGLISAR